MDSATLDLCLALADAGDEVTAVMNRDTALSPRLRTQPAVHLLEWQGRAYTWIWRLARVIRQRKIQIVQAHHGRDYWPAILAAKLSGISPCVVLSRHLMQAPSRLNRKFLLRVSDVVAASDALFLKLQPTLSGPRERLHRIYPGIDTDRFTPERSADCQKLRAAWGCDESSVIFGLVGHFSPPEGKGHFDLLTAAAEIRQQIPQARFVLAGPSPQDASLRQAIALLGLGDIVRIHGFSNEIPVVMNALDVLVHPPFGAEVLGLVILEALACEKPVIATRLDGIPETFVDDEHGLLVPPKKPAALAAAIKTLAFDANLRARFGKAGRQHVLNKFTRRHYAQHSREFYAAILGGRA